MSSVFEKILGHARPIRILLSSLERQAVAQAYLFHGEEGIGKRTVAREFAKAVMCTGEACESCRKADRGVHPDLIEIGPEGQTIKIGQIRALQTEIPLPPILGKKKVYLIDNTDRLNLEAANALLKTLEEPPSHAVLVLIAHRPDLLPETLRSRCQKILFTPPSGQEIERWLMEQTGCSREEARLRIAVAAGRPGGARLLDGEEAAARAKRSSLLTSPEQLASLPDLFSLSEEFSRDPETFISALSHLSHWLRDRRVEKALSASKDPSRFGTEEKLDRIFDLIQNVHGSLHRNLNRQLALDVILMEMSEAVGARAAGRRSGSDP
jgi:DNA polymerase-3 subunit delta'